MSYRRLKNLLVSVSIRHSLNSGALYYCKAKLPYIADTRLRELMQSVTYRNYVYTGFYK